MILLIAWVVFSIELIVAIIFGFIFWRLWSRSAMSTSTAITATTVYGLCCALCLILTFFVPL